MKAFRKFLAVLLLAAAAPGAAKSMEGGSAAAAPGAAKSMEGGSAAPALALAQTAQVPPFLGDAPDDPAVRAALVRDIRLFPDGELDAVMKVTLLCELDRGALSRRDNYLPWETRCIRTEEGWNGTFRRATAPRMIDAQMRHYTENRTALSHAAARYFDLKDFIARKAGTRNDIKLAVQEALEQRRKLAEISTRILKFFFTLRDLANEAKKS